MGFKPYILCSERLTSMARKAKVFNINKKDHPDKQMQTALIGTYQAIPQMKATLDLMIQAEEYNWLTSDRTVYFPENVELAKKIQKGSYSIDTEEALYDGEESFVIALPDELEFAGKKVRSGLLVNILPHSKRSAELFYPFFKWINQPPLPMEFDDSFGNFGLYICYQDSDNKAEYMRVCLPATNVIHALKFKTYKEYSEYMKETNNFSYLGGANLDKPEEAYQYEMLKFVAGFLVYKKALPERIKKGMPAQVRPKSITSALVPKNQPVTLHAPEHDSMKSAHYRSWHFRQLNHERYYRGTYKELPKGSRVVFVSDSYVGREVDAQTAT